MKIRFFLILTVVLLVISWGCTKQETSASEIDHAMQFYEEFLGGKRNAKIRYEDSSFGDAEFFEQWSRYAFYDMNGDNTPELLARGQGQYSIFTCIDEELIIWASPGIYAEALNNGAFLSARNNLFEMQYWYVEYNFYGNEKLRVEFGKAEPNDKGDYDENSAYYFEDKQVSMEEWNALTEKYLSIELASIEWSPYQDYKG